MDTLNLTLKKKWFDMILSGEKKEEYREVKDYWVRRLLVHDTPCAPEKAVLDELVIDLNNPYARHDSVNEVLCYFKMSLKQFGVIKFRNGYSKNSPCVTVEFAGINVKQGKEEWGAKKGEFYFTLLIGRVLAIRRN